MTLEATCSQEICKAEGHEICTYGTGFVSLGGLREILIGYGLDERLIDMVVLIDLCNLPGINGKFHCHCGDRMGLACRARTHLLHKAIMREIYNSKEMYIGGAELRFYGYNMCSCYIMCQRFWLKCDKRVVTKVMRFLSTLGLWLTRYEYSSHESLVEFKSYASIDSSQIEDRLKAFAQSENMGEGGELDFGGFKLKYGTTVDAFVRFQ